MATIEEAYSDAGVIHTEDCEVCAIEDRRQVVNIRPKQKKSVDKLIVGLVVLAIGFAVGVYVTWQPLPMERLYKDFKHVRIHEDGSFAGETRDGNSVSGCVTATLCKD